MDHFKRKWTAIKYTYKYARQTPSNWIRVHFSYYTCFQRLTSLGPQNKNKYGRGTGLSSMGGEWKASKSLLNRLRVQPGELTHALLYACHRLSRFFEGFSSCKYILQSVNIMNDLLEELTYSASSSLDCGSTSCITLTSNQLAEWHRSELRKVWRTRTAPQAEIHQIE